MEGPERQGWFAERSRGTGNPGPGTYGSRRSARPERALARLAYCAGVPGDGPAGSLGAASGETPRRTCNRRLDRTGHGPIAAGFDLPAVGVRRHQRADRDLSLSPGLALASTGGGERFVRYAANSIVIDGRADVLLPRRRFAGICRIRRGRSRADIAARTTRGRHFRTAKADTRAARPQGSRISAGGIQGRNEAAGQGENRNQAAQQGVEEARRARKVNHRTACVFAHPEFPGACSRRKTRSRSAKKRWSTPRQNTAPVQRQGNQTRQAGGQQGVEETTAGGKTRTAILSFAPQFPASSAQARRGRNNS